MLHNPLRLLPFIACAVLCKHLGLLLHPVWVQLCRGSSTLCFVQTFFSHVCLNDICSFPWYKRDAAGFLRSMTAPCMYLEHLNMPVALDGLCIELFVAATQVLHATRLQSLLLVVLDWELEVKLSHCTASWCTSSRRCKSQCNCLTGFTPICRVLALWCRLSGQQRQVPQLQVWHRLWQSVQVWRHLWVSLPCMHVAVQCMQRALL